MSPHSDTVWASSITICETVNSFIFDSILDFSIVSGFVRINLTEPSFISFHSLSLSALFCPPLKIPGFIPASINRLAWSAIRESRGNTTIVSPGRSTAGSIKQRDFPAPVGRITI